MKEQLLARIAEIEKAIQESVSNHNGLLVRLDDAKVMLKMVEECCEQVVVADKVIGEEVVASE